MRPVALARVMISDKVLASNNVASHGNQFEVENHHI